MPPNWMMDVGKQAGEFFETRRDVETGRGKSYRLKSLEQYGREHNCVEQPSKKYFKGTLLPEIIQAYDRDKGGTQRTEISPAGMNHPERNNIERHVRNSFIDFVNGLLRINPLERWTPQQARLHPFILDTEWTGPYKPPADVRSYNTSTSPSRAQAQPAQQVENRRPKHSSTYETPRYDPQTAPYESIPPPAQPPQIYYSPRHVQAQPPHQPPAQYLPPQLPPQQSHPYMSNFTHAPGMLPAYPQSQEWDPHRSARVRDNRPRASTIGNQDSIPLQLRQATARIDPAHQIRPSPAYYPPHDMESMINEDGDSTLRYAQPPYPDSGMRPRKKSQSHMQYPAGRGQPQGQGQMLVPPQQNLFKGSARALEDGLMPPWQ